MWGLFEIPVMLQQYSRGRASHGHGRACSSLSEILGKKFPADIKYATLSLRERINKLILSRAEVVMEHYLANTKPFTGKNITMQKQGHTARRSVESILKPDNNAIGK